MERLGTAEKRTRVNKEDFDDSSNKRGQVLTKAIINLANFLDLGRKDLKDILGTSEPTLVRIFKRDRIIDPESKEGELALQLIRIYRSLYAILGGDQESCRKWLRSKNTYFEKKPIESIKSVRGMIEVVQYLDAMRGQY